MVVKRVSARRQEGIGAEDPAAGINIRAKLLGLPEDTLVCSGHGKTSSIGAEKTSNPALSK